MITTRSRESTCGSLVEHIPDHLVKRWQDAAVFSTRLLIGGILAMFAPLCVALLWIPFRDSGSSVQLAVIAFSSITLCSLWFFAVYLIGTFARTGWTGTSLPVVEFCNDVVTVTWHHEIIEAPISECNLRVGRAWKMKYASRKSGGLPFGDRDLVLIDLPPLYRDVWGGCPFLHDRCCRVY